MQQRSARIRSGLASLGMILAIPFALGLLLAAVMARLLCVALAAALSPLGAG